MLRPMRPPWEELEPASRGAVERQRQSVRRIEQSTAVVFAASMALQTLLLLNHTNAAAREVATVAAALQVTWPVVLASALGLLVLLACWVVHHVQFHYLTKSSGSLLLIHVFLLPSALSVPLSTTLLYTLGFASHTALLLESNVLLIQVLLLLIWRHAVRGGLLFGSDIPRRAVLRVRLMLRLGVVASLVACGLVLASTTVGVSALVALLVAQIALIAKGGYTLDISPVEAHPTAD